MALNISALNLNNKSKKYMLDLLSNIDIKYKNLKNNNINIKDRISRIKEKANSGEDISSYKEEVFALVKLASEQTIGLSHFNTQMITADLVLNGVFTEMKTGEGKTLAITPAAIYKALSGKGVHIFTSNDYLAKTNCEELKPLYEALGISVSYITSTMSKEDKRKAYNSDIVYGSSEIIFDMLRDNTSTKKEDLVFKRASFAIVDEADDVFLDSARTPYVISGTKDNEKIKNLELHYKMANSFVLEEIFKKEKKGVKHFQDKRSFESENYYRSFDYGEDVYLYIIDDTKEIGLTEAGWLKAYVFYNRVSINKLANSLKKDIIENDLFIENKDYELLDNGRIKLTESGVGKAVDTYKEFKEHNNKFYTDINSIGNQHYIENALKAYYIIEKDKDYVITNDNGEKRLSLVIGGRTSNSRSYAEGLQQALELKEKSLNDKNIKLTIEHNDIASTSTVSFFNTMYDNYAGLTGTAPALSFYELYKKDTVEIPKNATLEDINYNPRVDNDTIVFKNSYDKVKAILEDIRLRHAKGQPILIGTTSVEESIILSKKLNEEGFNHNVLNAYVTDLEKEGEIISKAGRPYAITIATNMAGRGTDIKLGGTLDGAKEDILENLRKQIFIKWEHNGIPSNKFEEMFEHTFLSNPDFYKKLEQKAKEELKIRKKKVTQNGGLYVLGASLNRVKRIDDQLRGRSGRQTDPGESRFYTSIEELNSLGLDKYYTDKLKQRINGISISDEYSNKLIEKVQTINESNLTAYIKIVQEFDVEISSLQEKTYNQRRRILEGEEDLTRSVYFMIEKSINDTIGYNIPEYKNVDGNTKVKRSKIDYEKVSTDIENNFGIEITPDYIKDNFETLKDLASYLLVKVKKSYKEKMNGKTKEEIQKINQDIMLKTLDESWINFRELTKLKKDQHVLDIIGGNDKHDRVIEMKEDYNNSIRQARVEVVQSLFDRKKKKLETIEDKSLRKYSIDSNDYDNSYSVDGKIKNLNIFTRIKEKVKYIVNKNGFSNNNKTKKETNKRIK